VVSRIACGAGDVLHLGEDSPRGIEDALAGGRDAVQMLAVAFEDEHAKLVLEQADLLADAGLRCMQRLRGGGDIEPPTSDFVDIDKLA